MGMKIKNRKLLLMIGTIVINPVTISFDFPKDFDNNTEK